MSVLFSRNAFLELKCHHNISAYIFDCQFLHITFFFLLMNKILKCSVCFQKRGMKNYCVDTWLVSLPPTLALSDNTPGCPSPFEMLMGFLSVLLKTPPHLHLSSILFASFPCPQHCLSARFLHDLAPPFQQAAVCFLAVWKQRCVIISVCLVFFLILKSHYW